MVKLKAFGKFENTCAALQAVTKLIEETSRKVIPKPLRKCLVISLPKNI